MRLLFFPGTYTSPSSRFRVWQFVEPLRKMGHVVDVRVIEPHREWTPKVRKSILRKLRGRIGSAQRVWSALRLTRDVAAYDAVFLHKDIIPEQWGGFLDRRVQRLARKSFFDFDDAIHLGPRGDKLARLFPGYTCIVAGNEFLAKFGREHNPCVETWPTVVDTQVYQPRHQREPGPVRLGWSGSHHTLATCFPLIKGIIAKLARSVKFQFIVIADVEPRLDWEGVDWRFVRWTPETEVSGLQLIDIGLMPLKDEPFERGKCGLKAIQYMAVGSPALVSPVGVNAEIVVHGVTGFHCRSDDDWLCHAATLVEDESLRDGMGRKAAMRVAEQYSIKSLLPRMLKLFSDPRHGCCGVL